MYLILNVTIPATNPHMICPTICSKLIPLTMRGFPTINESGKNKLRVEKPKDSIPNKTLILKIKNKSGNNLCTEIIFRKTNHTTHLVNVYH
jgi:hypothetical protein